MGACIITLHFVEAQYFAEGIYAGNAIDNRSIAGLGFQPDVVV